MFAVNRKGLVVLPAMLASTVALGGCASVEGYARRPETVQVVESKRELFFGANAEAAYYAAVPEAERRRLRDRLVYGKMEVIEYDYETLERALNGTGNGVGLAGDIGVLALTGLAATTGGEGTKSTLAAISSGIVGAQGSISKNLYYQRTLPALLAQMEANRARVRAGIIANLAKSDDEYPLPAAIIDLRRLIRAGSIPASVSEITQQAVEEQADSQQIVDSLRNVAFSNSDPSRTLAAWLRPNGTQDPTRMAKLQAWLNKQPEAFLKQIPAGTFVRGDDPRLEPIRQRALQDQTLAITQ